MANSIGSRIGHRLRPLKDIGKQAVVSFPPSTVILTGVALLNLVLAITLLIQSQYLDNDVITSLTYLRDDGFCDRANEGVGIHCFSDYWVVADYGRQSNPWDNSQGLYNNYPAGSMLPHRVFDSIGTFLHSPRVGLIAYLVVMAIAMSIPAIWASAGKPAYLRVVIVAMFGFGSVPALLAFDRGNSVGFAVPALLAFIVAFQRKKYSLVSIAIVVAALIKPQYAVLAVALIAARQWKYFGWTALGVAATNLVAFLAWPQFFPSEISQAVYNTFRYGGATALNVVFPANTSLANGVHTIFEGIGVFGKLQVADDASTWVNNNASITGIIAAAVVIVIVVFVRRLPTVIAASLVLMTASLFPGISWPYYVLFVLPVAAVLLRDPLGAPPTHTWRGALDEFPMTRFQTLAVDVLLVAIVGSVSRIVFSYPLTSFSRAVEEKVLASTADLIPVLWIVATVLCAVAWLWPARKQSLPEPDTAPAELT